MKKLDSEPEALSNAILFWASIGISVSASIATVMKVETVVLVVSTLLGLIMGCLVGYYSRESSTEGTVVNESSILTWWQNLAKTERSALAMFGFIFVLILLFISGSVMGQAIFQ